MNKKLLDKSYTEGEVYQKVLYTSKKKDFSVAKLFLMPHSKILTHLHDSDNEIYIIPSATRKVRTCYKGNSHSLSNKSDDELIVYSIKWVD